MDYIKLKSFCTTKEIINKIKRQPIEWENIFANTSDKELISKLNKEPFIFTFYLKFLLKEIHFKCQLLPLLVSLKTTLLKIYVWFLIKEFSSFV